MGILIFNIEDRVKSRDGHYGVVLHCVVADDGVLGLSFWLP